MPPNSPSTRTPLFVRLPSEQAEQLTEAARRFRVTKGLIVAQAISNYLNRMDEAPTPQLLDTAAKFVNSVEPGTVVEGGVRPELRLLGGLRLIDPDAPVVGIDSLHGAPVGRHSFTQVDELEVLTLDQLATLLEVEVAAARDLAEQGELPGRKIGDEWRFSRRAVMDWLAGE